MARAVRGPGHGRNVGRTCPCGPALLRGVRRRLPAHRSSVRTQHATPSLLRARIGTDALRLRARRSARAARCLGEQPGSGRVRARSRVHARAGRAARRRDGVSREDDRARRSVRADRIRGRSACRRRCLRLHRRMRWTLVLAFAAAACGCNGVDPAARSDATSVVTVPCDDGTGATDCCANRVKDSGSCSQVATCWNRCVSGGRSQLTCNGATWIAGHGLFPCGADAGR